MYAGEEGNHFLRLLLHVPVQLQEYKYMCDKIITCSTSGHVFPHDTYMYMYMYILLMCTCISKLSLQLSVVAFSFSHVHFSPHIPNDSFITTFTSLLTVCKFLLSLYCSCTCDAITCFSSLVPRLKLSSACMQLLYEATIEPPKNTPRKKQTCMWHVHGV